MISPKLCVKCKGRLFCGMSSCPILDRYSRHAAASQNIVGNEFTGSSPPGFFVGWTNYPKVPVAPLAPTSILNNAQILDNPENWYGLPQEKIISFREQLVSSKTAFAVDAASNPSYKLAELQEIAMSNTPVVVDIELFSKPEPNLSFEAYSAPTGMSANLKKFSFVDNPKIPKKTENVVSDADMKSIDGMRTLYDAGISIYNIQKLLSAGLLGVKKNRVLVPTRWSIAALDDNISKIVIDKVKGFQQISEYEVFYGKYLDNTFYILLLPSEWQFEQLEAWGADSTWAKGSSEAIVVSDHEFYRGRTSYADNVTGAYYAARLSIAEHLADRRKQAGAIVFREIGAGYQLPLGVWVIRETVKNAMQQNSLKFSSLPLALAYIGTKLSIPMKNYRKNSALIENLTNQKKITQWF